jgi:putative phosphoribosyl transferase
MIELLELDRRNVLFRRDKTARVVDDFDLAILVDDGIATGATMKAAIEALRRLSDVKICVAVPVAAPDTYLQIKSMVDLMVCLEVPSTFYGVGQFYQDFTQLSDDEVVRILHEHNKH